MKRKKSGAIRVDACHLCVCVCVRMLCVCTRCNTCNECGKHTNPEPVNSKSNQRREKIIRISKSFIFIHYSAMLSVKVKEMTMHALTFVRASASALQSQRKFEARSMRDIKCMRNSDGQRPSYTRQGREYFARHMPYNVDRLPSGHV